jgi:hypothetical protein
MPPCSVFSVDMRSHKLLYLGQPVQRQEGTWVTPIQKRPSQWARLGRPAQMQDSRTNEECGLCSVEFSQQMTGSYLHM